MTHMKLFDRTAPFRLLAGDLISFLISLYVMLFFRSLHAPDENLFVSHLIPFLLIFGVSLVVFYIAGLYDYHTTVFKRKLGGLILNAQLVNSIIAVMFFYFVPFFGIAPKTNLFLYIVFSSIAIVLWRLVIEQVFASKKSYEAAIFGRGESMRELVEQTNTYNRSSIKIKHSFDLDTLSDKELQEALHQISKKNIAFFIADFSSTKAQVIVPNLYELIFSEAVILDFHDMYEELFEKVSLSSISYEWFLEHISNVRKPVYDFLKRAIDIVFSLIGAILSLVVYPFVIIAIKLEDKGPVFIVQKRIGKNNKEIKMFKFRSMNSNDTGVWQTELYDRITKVGRILRKTRIDELPQLWNVLTGDISLIGPRPDIIDLGAQLKEEIPYYAVRNLIQPGLSGWAQIKQDIPPHSVEETKIRLAYDIYYVKNRSFLLDVSIMLKTIRTLLSRSGK